MEIMHPTDPTAQGRPGVIHFASLSVLNGTFETFIALGYRSRSSHLQSDKAIQEKRGKPETAICNRNLIMGKALLFIYLFLLRFMEGICLTDELIVNLLCVMQKYIADLN